MEVDKAVAVTAMPIPTSPVKTQHISKCSCKILCQSVLKLQQEKITAVKRESIKRLNQKIKRKELQFSKVKSQFNSSVLAKDLEAAKIKISSLEKKHLRLKRYHKMKQMGFFHQKLVKEEYWNWKGSC